MPKFLPLGTMPEKSVNDECQKLREQKPNRKGKNAGFTLIEMLVAVVIIATLAAMIVPRFAGRTEEAKSSAAGADS